MNIRNCQPERGVRGRKSDSAPKSGQSVVVVTKMESGSGGGGSGEDPDVSDPHRRKKRYHKHTARQIQELEAVVGKCISMRLLMRLLFSTFKRRPTRNGPIWRITLFLLFVGTQVHIHILLHAFFLELSVFSSKQE